MVILGEKSCKQISNLALLKERFTKISWKVIACSINFQDNMDYEKQRGILVLVNIYSL